MLSLSHKKIFTSMDVTFVEQESFFPSPYSRDSWISLFSIPSSSYAHENSLRLIDPIQ